MDSKYFFEQLWQNYTAITPSAEKVKTLFENKGDTVFNDHIALRTFNDPRVNIEVLSRPFLTMGYEAKGEYHFKAKKLYAKHFEHKTDANAPKIFISELLLEEVSLALHSSIQKILDQVNPTVFEAEDLVLKGRVWEKPVYAVYEKFLAESEYAAWMYVNGFCSNHFTVDVNKLKSFDTLSEVNEFLKLCGFKMNTSGGEIKGNSSLYLEQSSILADTIDVAFEEKTRKITSCYYEFAFRYAKEDGSLFTGFVANSADKIFESTDMELQKTS
ncbi:DUF1338 domain-containing protein [Aquimarina gracilis]|uniref:2-oxoadipate dioxygenase/decarboxylase n=1 Tax=Aquimarina gracilis TaxID=874422 RepID=A0ABU5ZXJ0_9FLAO|nr:DUF1338 domain-containing protein [Aquimarina gracilis]MEB3346591.1 DUF1338 domain-containing protein [Aquimarina gracilis]